MSAQPQVTTARIADWLWSQDLGYTIDDDRNIVLRFEAFTIYIFVGAEFSDLLPVRGYWRPELAGKTIVTVLPDTGERYLSTPLYKDFLD